MEKATIFDYARMCKTYDDCKICPLGFNNNGKSINCDYKVRAYPDKANEIILNWCKEHPVKTRQSEFLKMFPNAGVVNGVIAICPKSVEATLRCNIKSCEKCGKEYWLAEVE